MSIFFEQNILEEKKLFDTQKTNSFKPTNFNSALYKRARAKFMTIPLLLQLIDLKSPLLKSYWNSYHCAEVLHEEYDPTTDIQKFRSKYCNGRWCLVCNRMRTAKLIKGYEDSLDELENQHFLTLTIQNVPEHKLKDAIEYMYLSIRNIQKRLKKDKILGIRKFECTFSNVLKNYHPHYHFITSGDRSDVIYEWINEINKHKLFYADSRAQDCRKADDQSKKELFKYFTKVMSSKDADGQDQSVPIYALDQIFQAIVGKRVFQSMGLKKFVEEDIDSTKLEVQEILKRSGNLQELTEKEADILNNYEKWYLVRKDWNWAQDVADWLDEDSNALTQYKPSNKVLNFLDKIR
jgi:hypothetical protein